MFGKWLTCHMHIDLYDLQAGDLRHTLHWAIFLASPHNIQVDQFWVADFRWNKVTQASCTSGWWKSQGYELHNLSKHSRHCMAVLSSAAWKQCHLCHASYIIPALQVTCDTLDERNNLSAVSAPMKIITGLARPARMACRRRC